MEFMDRFRIQKSTYKDNTPNNSGSSKPIEHRCPSVVTDE